MDEREVPVQRLDQQTPGRFGAFTRTIADEGINIEMLYSDHANRLIAAADDIEAGRRVSEERTDSRT